MSGIRIFGYRPPRSQLIKARNNFDDFTRRLYRGARSGARKLDRALDRGFRKASQVTQYAADLGGKIESGANAADRATGGGLNLLAERYGPIGIVRDTFNAGNTAVQNLNKLRIRAEKRKRAHDQQGGFEGLVKKARRTYNKYRY